MVNTLKKSAKLDPLDELVSELLRDGICIIRGLLDREKLRNWHDALADVCQSRSRMDGGLAARESNRFYLTLPWISPFAESDIFANSTILSILDRVLRNNYSMVQLGADYPLKGSGFREIHRDHAPLFGDEVTTPLYALAVNFPLSMQLKRMVRYR